MNMFSKAKEQAERVTGGKVTRNCDHCGTPYEADSRNLKRGWGKCCSKSCAASLREKSRPGYDPARVAENNIRRVLWNDLKDGNGARDENEYGVYRGRRTSEGYKMYERENDEFTAIDEFGDPIYNGHTWYDDPGDSEYWEGK